MESFWYVLKVIPGKERQITENLNQQINLGRLNNVLRFICPTEKEFINVKNKKVLREKVLYNGYLYFETNHVLNEDELKDFSTIPNTMGMLGDKKPILMRKNDVEKILKDDILDDFVENKKLKYLIGEEVMVNDGAFKTFTGVINKTYDDKVDLDIKIFGRSSIVTLNIYQISKKQ
jgi:transcription antitermination factor NusG